MTNIKKFIDRLNKADVIKINDLKILITEYAVSPYIGKPDQSVVHFEWQDGEFTDTLHLTEGAIENGIFNDDGSFLAAHGTPGKYTDIVLIRFFVLTPLPV